MKKTLLILFPYSFTEFEYFRFELSYFENKHNYEVIIHDLSNILTNKNLNQIWKTKKEKKAIKFSSLRLWIHEFNKIKKRKNILIYDLVQKDSFSALIIKIFLKFSKHPILYQDGENVCEWVPKKNFKYFLEKILEHKLNLRVYLYAIKCVFFQLLIKCIKFNKIFFMTNKDLNLNNFNKNTYLIKSHSHDYSNAILEKYKKSNAINSEQFIVYFDDGGPYFTGDTLLNGRILPKNSTEKWYEELHLFFDYLEKIFKSKILVIPHPKYRIPDLKNKNLNPYFNNRLNDNSYDASAKFISSSLFVVSRGSTAVSYAIANLKPVQLIYSSNYKYVKNEIETVFLQANMLGLLPIDITSLKKEEIIQNLEINKTKYDLYKYRFLTHKSISNQKSNYKIIQQIMDKSI